MSREIQQQLHEWQEIIRQELTHPKFAESPEYLSVPMHYALNAAGKMLRPALCLAATEAVGGRWQDAVQLAVALEVFHTFTLVHDDIMDGDDLRRGIPTVHKAYGSERALLSGDTLLIYVYQLLAEIGDGKFPQVFRAFNDGAMDVCKGQGWDMQFERSPDIEPQQYEMMIDLKTGALIKLACQLGAIIGGGDDAAIHALSRFGLLLGRAFQMQDDLLEMTSSEKTMGKSLGSDMLNEKKTWIWLDLKSRLDTSQLAQWKKIQDSGKLKESDRKRVKSWMIDHGTIKRAQSLVHDWIAEADDLLSSKAFTNITMLKALADIILSRKH